MTCEKCGLFIQHPGTTCPRCGVLLPQLQVVRNGLEEGSLDAWSGETIDSTETLKYQEDEDISFLEAHPSAKMFLGALAIRISFYIVGLLLLLADVSVWSGLGVWINLAIAIAPAFLVVVQPEEQDFYWLKPIATIAILADTIITLMIALAPVATKIIVILSQFL